MWFDKNRYHIQISDAKFCIYANVQPLVIILLEVANFDPIFSHPVDPQELENSVPMGNRSVYQVSLKKNRCLKKTTETLTSPKYPKDPGFRPV